MVTEQTFFPGTRVMVFDPRLFVDDKKTPLSVTMKPATVLRWYGKRSNYGGWIDSDLIDVDFDHRGESRAHFTNTVRIILMKELISSVRVEYGPGHDHVHVWNRGGKAGVLVVNEGEGDHIAARLLAPQSGEHND